MSASISIKLAAKTQLSDDRVRTSVGTGHEQDTHDQLAVQLSQVEQRDSEVGDDGLHEPPSQQAPLRTRGPGCACKARRLT